MKKLLSAFLLSFTLLLAACSVSTEDLAKEVQANMEQKFAGEGIRITSFMLTKKGGNEYAGVLETAEPNGEFTYSVKVIYDGSSFTWEIVQ